jgi:hypothetical protein
VCPSCAAEHARTERFCRDCGLPLVLSGEEPGEDLSEARERARKVLPRYSEGPLVKVGSARNQAEAEMLENLLLEEGIPSLVRRSGGFDVPDFLAAGPRDVLVPQSGAETAREVLLQADLAPTTGDGGGPRPLVLAAVIALGGLITALIAWLASQGGV